MLINLQGSWGNSLSYRYIKGFTISDKIDVVGGTFQVNSNNKEIIEDSQANRNDVKITYYLSINILIHGELQNSGVIPIIDIYTLKMELSRQ